MSGKFWSRISLKRRTVIGFPNPQQFQLAIVKEEEEEVENENPPISS